MDNYVKNLFSTLKNFFLQMAKILKKNRSKN